MALIDTLTRRIRGTDNPGRYNGTSSGWGWPFSAGIGSWRTDTWRSPQGPGPAVNDNTALSLTPFYRGIALIAGTVGGMPMQVYQEEIDGDGVEGKTVKLKTPDTEHIWLRPNGEMTRQSFWERIVADEVRGNAFIFVVKNARGEVVQEGDVQDGADWGIWHIERSRVQVGRSTEGVKVYLLDGDEPYIDFRAGGEIIHIPNWGSGLVGYDPVKIGANAIRLGLSAEQYAAQFFTHGGPDGIISTEQTLTKEQANEVLKEWRRVTSGANARGTAFLGSGAKFQQTSMDSDKAQLIETRGFQVAEQARLLGLPPALLGDVDHSSQGGGSGVEEMNRTLLVFNFQAHINRIEQAVSDDLLRRRKTNRYAKMNTAALLRGTTLQLYQALRLATFMTEDEKRALLDMEPKGGAADELLAMTNMLPIDELERQALSAGQGGGQ